MVGLMSRDANATAGRRSLALYIQQQPATAFLIAALVAILAYFFGFLPFFVKGEQSTLVWAWQSWN
ncbi:MAG TPA: hypothetical protein VGC85_12045, partial [Chthoniobacterales bacterium]